MKKPPNRQIALLGGDKVLISVARRRATQLFRQIAELRYRRDVERTVDTLAENS